MPRHTSDWRQLLFAAERKLRISEYHLEQLRRELSSPELQGDAVPPIPVQAHFEGVLVTLPSAENQLAEAAKIALGLDLPEGRVLKGGMQQLGRLVPEIRVWSGHEIVKDLRHIRNRIIHYCYLKDPEARDHRWRVESADTHFAGSRELLAYASAAVEHGRRLLPHLPLIEVALSSKQ
jgi:hypothetical protein